MSYRTRLGGDLRAADAGTPRDPRGLGRRGGATTAAWCSSTCATRGGLVQLVFDPADQPEAHATRTSCATSSSSRSRAWSRRASPRRSTRSCATGQVEVRADRLTVLARAGVLPFQLDEEGVDESLRLHHRYLDLRRDRMRHNIWTRFKLTQTIRRHMEDNGFWELETPILYKSTPEGAREFVVPTSSHPGKFYALPQSPQTFKQLYAISGFERYYQIAKCFRDEATRADRTQEFTQLDIEMAFLEPDELFSLLEELWAKVWREVLGVELATPFRRMSWDEATLRYGSDKPDLRFGCEIADVTDALRGTEFKAFGGVIEGGGVVRGFAGAGRAGVLAQGLRRPGRVRQDVGRQGRRLAAGDGRRDPLADRQVPVAGGAGRDRRRDRRGGRRHGLPGGRRARRPRCACSGRCACTWASGSA